MSAEPPKETLPTGSDAVGTAPASTEPTTETSPSTDAPAAATQDTLEITKADPTPTADELPKEEKVGENAVKIEAKPIAAGNLGYKGPGLIK